MVGVNPDFDKILEKLAAWPWKLVGIVVAIAFAVSFCVSIAVSIFLAPSPVSKSQAATPVPVMAGVDPSVQQGGKAALTNSDIDAILKRNIFNSDGKLGDTEEPEEGEGSESGKPAQLVKTELPIKVIGIIYGGSPYIGLVTIENTQKKRINSFVVGDSIQSDAKLIEIRRDRIIMDRNGRREFALLEEFKIERSKRKKKSKPGSAGPTIAAIATGPPPENFKEEGFERDGGSIRMTSEYKNRIIGEDMTKTLQDAKAEPNIDKETGQLRGFRLTRIREGSIYQKAGLQNDDVVEEINGVALTNTAGAINLLQSLKGESSIEVRINRSGTPMTFTLSVN
jgi:type II secretion system protein C